MHRHDFLQASSWCHMGAPCETSVCSRLKCTMKVSNKTRLFCRQEHLRYPAKKIPLLSLDDAVDADDFGGTFHLSQMDRKSLPVHRESAQFVTRRRFSLQIRPRVAETLEDANVLFCCIIQAILFLLKNYKVQNTSFSFKVFSILLFLTTSKSSLCSIIFI